jgi:salicylate hydroxylase
VIVAGAGIGGLTTAFALARNGFRVTVLEQSERLEETGAGIQLSPNAARILIDLGLGERLRPHVTAPDALRVLDVRTGREIVRMPLGEAAAQRYGAPYWVIHRADLQAVLGTAVSAKRDISIKLGVALEDFAAHANGIVASARARSGIWHESGGALIAADGLWSKARTRLGYADAPVFAGRTAWRALVPANHVAPEFRAPLIHLWLGGNAHLVHYPVKGGSEINIVVIMTDRADAPGWSEPERSADLLARLPTQGWALPARALIGTPSSWLKWSLYECRPLPNWSHGPVALLGDAAHPVLPFLAQGAAMAIEDAAVAAQCLAHRPDDAAEALRTYAAIRRGRTAKVQNLAARTGARYHLTGTRRMLRDSTMRVLGGSQLLRHYDWLYDWRLPTALSLT